MRGFTPFWPFWAKMGLFGPRRAPPGGGFTSTPGGPPGGSPRGLGGPPGASGSPGGVSGTRSPDPGSWGSPDPWSGTPAPGGRGPPGTPGPRFREGFYINPSRRGPAVPRRGSGTGGPRGPVSRASREAPDATPPGRGSGPLSQTPRGTAGVGSPRRGRRGLPSLLPEEAVRSSGTVCRRSGRVKGISST